MEGDADAENFMQLMNVEDLLVVEELGKQPKTTSHCPRIEE